MGIYHSGLTEWRSIQGRRVISARQRQNGMCWERYLCADFSICLCICFSNFSGFNAVITQKIHDFCLLLPASVLVQGQISLAVTMAGCITSLTFKPFFLLSVYLRLFSFFWNFKLPLDWMLAQSWPLIKARFFIMSVGDWWRSSQISSHLPCLPLQLLRKSKGSASW